MRQPKERKRKVIDPTKEEEIAQRIAAVEAKRQKFISEVELSLKRRRFDRKTIENARLDIEENIRQKEIRDAKKLHGERAMVQIRQDLRAIIEAGIESIQPSVIVPAKIKYDGRATMTIKDVKYKVKNNLHIVGWGKEAGIMSTALERVVGKQLKKGFIVVPRKSISAMWSYPEAFPKLDSRIKFVEVGTNGLPDSEAIDIGRKIANYCKRLKKRDLLIVMLSRDSDDLLCCPRDTITLRDKLRVLNRLKAANATPREINIVRNKLSAIRGGDLARLAYPAKVITLFASDVSAEPPERLAGGPCVYEAKDHRALAVLTKYKLLDKVSQSVREALGAPSPAATADVQLDEDGRYNFVRQYVIACNADAMEHMATQALRLGLSPTKLVSTCSGTVDEFAQEYAKVASLMVLAAERKITRLELYRQMRESPVCWLSDRQVWEIFPTDDKWALGLCLLLGGRASVHVGDGRSARSGPNQELALRFSLYWCVRTKQYPILRGYTVWFVGGSSYGRDGNTSAAGAYGYESLAGNVYMEYEKARSEQKAALQKLRELVEDKQSPASAIAEARRGATGATETCEKYAAVLPERVLRESNSNLLFACINDGDELLPPKPGNDYTAVDVGDLHVIRIARYRCSCSGDCHADEDGPRTDRDRPVNRTLSAK